MKRAAKEMELDEDEIEELDTSLNIKDLQKSKTPIKHKVAKIVTEIEADEEMEEI